MSPPEAGSWLADVEAAGVGSHAVTFYDDEDALVDLAAAFLAPAHQAGGVAVALVDPARVPALAEALARAGVAVTDRGGGLRVEDPGRR